MNDLMFFGFLIFLIVLVMLYLLVSWVLRRRRETLRSHPLDANIVAAHSDGSFHVAIQNESSPKSDSTSVEQLAPSPFDDDEAGTIYVPQSSSIQHKCRRIAQKKKIKPLVHRSVAVEDSEE